MTLCFLAPLLFLNPGNIERLHDAVMYQIASILHPTHISTIRCQKIACAACICIIWAFCCSICLSTMLCQTQQRNFQTQRLVMPAHRRTQVPISVSVSSESSSSVPISEFFLGSFVLSLNLNMISLIIFIYPNILISLNTSQYILIYLN